MTAFDTLAADYDRTFTDTRLGQILRRKVWSTLDTVVRSGDSLLELNCGTGEDAVHLARRGVRVHATDSAPAMVEATRHKAHDADVSHLVDARVRAIEDLGSLDGTYDAVLSNFGGLNCVDGLDGVARNLARLVRTGGSVVLVIMGPAVPWEWAWFLARRQPAQAFRRFRPASWRGLTIRYPSPATVRRAFAADFRPTRCLPIGVALPPSYAESLMVARPRWLARLERAEQFAARVPGSAWLADHYLLQLERR